MKFQSTAFILLVLSAPFALWAEKGEATWRKLLKDHANCVTWVSATVRVEVAPQQKHAPAGTKAEALGTIIAEDGLTVLSLSRVDPTATLLSRIRTPGGSVNVNYTEVLLLMQDGTEVPAKLLLKDTDSGLGLRFANQGKG